MDYVERAGQTISENRLEDLKKEYSAIVPALEHYISIFRGRNPELIVELLIVEFTRILESESDDSLVLQDFLITGPNDVLRILYSIGFLGVRDSVTGSYIFCHDGRSPDRKFEKSDKFLIHPCYWMSLNCSRNTLHPDEAEEIFDEYDIEISSKTPAIRNARIVEIIRQLSQIEEGMDHASQFEQWCCEAIRICFSKGLRNVELKPNKNARMRRDIVATNLSEGNAWRRIYDDYSTRQVIFEIKNYQGLTAADYYQMISYLSGEYGKLGFFVTRDETVELYSGKDVEWVREVYLAKEIIVIKLTGKYLARLLGRLKNPAKHDAVNDALHKLLDTYARLYLAGQGKPLPQKQKRGPKMTRKRRKSAKL